MTDVRAILEQQSRIRKRRGKLNKAFTVFCVALFIALAIANNARGRPIDDTIRLLFPLMFLGGAGAYYSARHIQALRDAIVDPDPSLDRHFAEALSMESKEVAAIGRQAFLERFTHRAPELDDVGWVAVVGGLSRASVSEADGLMSILKQKGSFAAVALLEAFATKTEHERLKTAAQSALGDIRFRTARDRIVAVSEAADVDQESERARLGLRV